MDNTQLSYAQNREDIIIATLFRDFKKGFYVDVGANYETRDSVTKYLYANGWSGINIEPITSLYKELKKKRKRDINLNIGISSKAGSLTLREYENEMHGWSTFSDVIKKKHGDKYGYKDYEVKTLPLSELFAKYKVRTIDMLKIDVEGLEYEVLASNDWQKFRPKVVVVENTPGKWTALLKKEGYVEVFFDGLNKYYVASEWHKDLSAELFMREYHKVADSQYIIENKRALKELSEVNHRLKVIDDNPGSYFSAKILCFAVLSKLKNKIGL